MTTERKEQEIAKAKVTANANRLTGQKMRVAATFPLN